MNAISRTRSRRGLGQYHTAYHTTVHTATPVTPSDIETELKSRGYVEYTAPVPTNGPPPPTVPTLTKSMAISVAVDEALRMLSIPHTTTHPFRAPTSNFSIPRTTWANIVNWCVTVASGYMDARYRLPSWAQTALHTGQLRGLARGSLGGWIEDNPWAVKTVGDLFNNYGDFLTVKNVKDSIDAVAANTKGSLSKDDIPALLSMLQQGGYIKTEQMATVETGARQAATMNWTPFLIVGGIVGAIVLLARR